MKKQGQLLVGIVGLLALNFFGTGCVSMSGLQTARTVEPGKAEMVVGAGTYQSGAITDAIREDGAVKGDSLSIPFAEFSYRQGISKDWDAGLKLTFIGSAVVDGKYSLIEGKSFAASIGAGVGYLSISSGTGDDKTESQIMDLIVPLYLSYDVAENFAIYGAPKYIQRSISGDASGSVALTGGTAGVKIGKTWGTYIEASQLKDSKSDFTLSQGNVALFWDTGTWF